MRTARAWTLALLAVLVPASAVAAGIARFTLSVSPLVAELFPMQVRAGQQAVLRLRGRALHNGLVASFGAGIAADPVSSASADSSQASLRIRVSPGAPAGRRQLILVLGGRRVPQNAYITVQAPQVTIHATPPIHLRSQSSSTGIAAPLSILSRVTPQSVRAGSRSQLTLEGSGLEPGLRLDYGPGVHVESVQVLGATRANVTVRVDATAPAGRRVPRASEPAARVQVMPLAALNIAGAPVKVYGTVQAPPAPGRRPPGIRIAPTPGIRPLVAPARLLSVTPNRLDAGKDYRVTAYGENLRAGLELDLGTGVRIGSVDVLDARRAEIALHVSAKALPGLRHARLRAGNGRLWAAQPATLLVQKPFHIARLPQPKLPAFNAKTMIEGRIILKSPKWYSGLASIPAPINPVTGKPTGPGEVVKTGVHVPTVKDESLFIWREQNPGVAEWFEVRFYAGKKLIATRRVKKRYVAFVHKKMLPNWLIPDPDLVATLAAAAPTARYVSRNKKGGVEVHGTVGKKTAIGGHKDELPPSDVTWEVTGYRRYFKSGIEAHAALEARRPVLLASLSSGIPPSGGMGAMVPREVERSDRWPVNAPYHPTGLGCGSVAPSGLDVMDIDNSATSGNQQSSNEASTSQHTGERWQLSGTLNFGRSPWASHPQKFQPAAGHPKVVQSTTWRFDNVYVDWGDGTVLPLAITQKGAQEYHADTKLSIGPNGTENSFLHAYSALGSYTIRVYQLAEADIQNESAGNVSVVANPQGSLYATAQAATGGGSGGSNGSNGKAAPPDFHHAKATGKHAYMLLCKSVKISPRHDSDSDGPLNLVAAKVRGFPEQPGDDSPPKGVRLGPPAPKHPSNGSGSSKAVGHSTATGSHHVAAGFGGEPSFSTCDVSLTGGGYLYYYGQGKVRLTWYLDGAPMGSSSLPLGPSTPRSDQVLSGKDPGPPLVSASNLITSPSIALTQKQIGHHQLSFDAQVQYDARGLTRLSGLMGRALGSGGRKADRKLAAQLAAGLHGAPALGVLPPQGVHVAAGADPVAWLDAPLEHVARGRPAPVLVAALSASHSGNAIGLGGLFNSAARLPKHGPPAYVSAPARGYQVLGAKSGEACIFHFPVKDGEFIVGGLQSSGGKSNVTHEGNVWSGSGKLIIHLDGGKTDWHVRLDFKDWTLDKDGTTVVSGRFDVPNPIQSQLTMSGADVQVTRLQGNAGDSVRMTLSAALDNPNILASADQKPPPPLKATAVLTPKGDWYADGLKLPELDVYDSGFSVAPKTVALDLSASEGSTCGAGKSWMGVAFDSDSMLNAYTFELKKTQSTAVSGWGIDPEGLCGSKTFGAYDSKVERGTIHWDGIVADASDGKFTATYKGTRVHVPWLDADLKSDSQALHAGKGSGGGHLSLNLSGKLPMRTFGPVSMRADLLEFVTLKGVGWAVQAGKTLFSFKADGRQFAKDVAVPNLYFGMNGRAYFEENGGSENVSLSGAKGRLSQGVVDLKAMDIVATPKASSRLLFNFSTELRISDALPAAPAPVSYRIDEVSDSKYNGSGPVTGKFVIHKPFPDANPSTDSVIHPDYVGPTGGKSASADAGGWLISSAHASSGEHMTYCGDVDLGMFSGPPVKGGFALGYQGSDDFWAAHADVSLGQTGTPLVPPFMTLYGIGGGLGYNIALDSFASGNICAVSANIDHTPLFNAHVVVGDPTHFTYGFDGELSVKVTGSDSGARMDYKAWLVRNEWKGGGDFHGKFLYANGNFDGTLNGHYAFLDNKAYIEAKNDAISMHFGGGKWYIHAGTEPNPVRGHVLIVDAGAWLGLGSEGMYAGAKAHLNQGAGSCDGTCARVITDAVVKAEITPQPHFKADAHMHVNAHACAFDICLGAGLGGKFHAAALPPELAFAFNLGGCPPGHLDVGVEILPTPKPHVGGGLCAW